MGKKAFALPQRTPRTASYRRCSSDAPKTAPSATDLQQLVAKYGGKPEMGGSVAGAMHRGWMNLKAAASGRTDLAILEECERGEDVAKARYRKALEDPLPEDIRMVVQRVSLRRT
jgi:uncharacterized protein (TIGR02284 family)